MTMTMTGHQKVMKEERRAYGRLALKTQNPDLSSTSDLPDLANFFQSSMHYGLSPLGIGKFKDWPK